MPDTTAFTLGHVKGFQSTEDGSQLLLISEQPTGNETLFAIRDDHVCDLIAILAIGHMRCRSLQGVPSDRRDAFTVARWELGFQPGDAPAALSLTIPYGGRLDFHLSTPMVREISEMLRAYLEPAASLPAAKSVN